MRLGFALLGLMIAVPVLAQERPGAAAPAPTNDDCLMCHGDPDAKRDDGSLIAVDAAKFTKSVHGQLDLKCIDCHADLASAEFPHPPKLAKVECSTCHADASDAYKKSVHAAAVAAGRKGAPACASCHGAHDILPSSDPESRTYQLNLSQMCGKCHGEQAPAAGLPGGNIFGQFHDSIHGRALERSGLLVAPSCASCHGAHDILSKKSPESRVNRANVPTTCGKCHGGVERIYAQSIHGQLVSKGDARAPVCINCHTAHAVQSATGDAFRVRVVDHACGECHKESLATYRDTFHGQVTELGYAAVATCADCHSAHEQFPKSDARSHVSAANRVKTCQKCHAGANENFAKYDPHANAHSYERSPLLYFSARFMQVLLFGVFGFFGLHTGLWFMRSVKDMRARRPGAHHTGKGKE